MSKRNRKRKTKLEPKHSGTPAIKKISDTSVSSSSEEPSKEASNHNVSPQKELEKLLNSVRNFKSCDELSINFKKREILFKDDGIYHLIDFEGKEILTYAIKGKEILAYTIEGKEIRT